MHFIITAIFPPVVFTGLKVDNNTVVPGEQGIIDVDIAMARQINLDYKQNFSIDFNTLDFTSPNECQYLYKLEGFNTDWNAIGANKTAVFTNLDPGSYTLLVKAYSPNGEWTSEAARMAVYIKSPFWRTGWALHFMYCLLLLHSGASGNAVCAGCNESLQQNRSGGRSNS